MCVLGARILLKIKKAMSASMFFRRRFLLIVIDELSLWVPNLFEPPNDKTNKVSVRPAKTQINLDIRTV